MQVTKKDGSLVDFDMSKIKKVVGWACEGLDVNPVELESHIDIIFISGISTEKIQANLVQQAVKLTTSETPDWKYVAGRLVIMPRWKQNLGHKSFARFIEAKVNSGEYSNSLLIEYTDDELDYLSDSIVNSRDLDFDYAGANVLVKRYLLEGESPQIAFMAIAALLALPQHKAQRLETAIRFYEAFSTLKISLATPLLMNLRRPNGNLASCFVTEIQDSLDSITDIWDDVAQISKQGGGVGVSVSKLRSKGASIRGVEGAASGVVPCIKVLNDIAIYINQLSSRAGAFTVALESWHADLLDFLEIQTETGDLRTKAFDVFPQLVVSDYFMNCVKNDLSWYLFDPDEVRNKLGLELAELWGEEQKRALLLAKESNLTSMVTVRARDIIKTVIKLYLETGLPYVTFKDTWNRDNPNKHDGQIPCTNLCVESTSNVSKDSSHVCQLVSLVLANCSLNEIPELCDIAVNVLDNAIELTAMPIEKAQTHNDQYRVIGIGVLGLADLIAREGLSYLHEDTDEFLNTLFEDISYHSALASCKLAMERGRYAKFEDSDWDNGDRISKLEARSNYPGKWYELQALINEHGIRNSQLLAVAPNTSSSLVMGCAASILPVFKKFFIDNNSNGAIPISAKYIKDYFWGYTEYSHVPIKTMNTLVSTMQFWIDTGISYEILFNLNNEEVNAKYIFEAIIDAWEKDIKSLYYCRIITKDGISNDKEECISCAS